jgi:Ca2+-binding EF-hand superfamily protein
MASEEEEENDNNGKHIPPSFDSVDTNGDGVIDQEELDLYRGKEQEDPENPDDPSSPDDGEDKSKMSAFASFDKDKDGFITKEELAAHSKYSNPGNGSGERKIDEGASSSSDGQRNNGNNRGGNKENNKGKGKNK